MERALLRHPAIAEAAVYGVPDPVAGDQIMACIVLRGGASLAPAEALTRVLAADRWNTPDPVWWRPDGRSLAYVPLDAEQAAALDAAVGARLPAQGPNGPPRGDFGPQRRATPQDKAGETKQTANGGGE